MSASSISLRLALRRGFSLSLVLEQSAHEPIEIAVNQYVADCGVDPIQKSLSLDDMSPPRVSHNYKRAHWLLTVAEATLLGKIAEAEIELQDLSIREQVSKDFKQ